jgi:glycosyltransferase involved in cell wall biosynthesis
MTQMSKMSSNESIPVITVLMPVYNGEQFIKEAIESILSQSFTNFEFLIIDDGSTDTTPQIVQSYVDSRIRYIKNEKNLGISHTLNKGLEMASAELIARMDADDISYPNRLQKQYEYLESHPSCALLSSWAREILENGEPIKVEEWESDTYYYNLNFECVIYHPTVMYRRSVVIDIGGYSIPYCEDYDLWWKIARDFEIHNLSEVLIDYRSTTSSLSRVTKKEEYENAQQQLVLRNIIHYTGPKFHLKEYELAYLRYEPDMILKQNNLQAIITCFDKLNYISKCIMKKENVNRDIRSIRKAASRKKEWMIYLLRAQISKKQLVWLLICTLSWQLLWKISIIEIVNEIKSIKKMWFHN